jgi:hypothetical protein
MADRKSRFALVILGAVNALNILVIARPEALSLDTARLATLFGLYISTYLVLSLALFVLAISALKPRMTIVASRVDAPEGTAHPVLGLRFIRNILEPSFEEYYQRWKRAQFMDVNREIALHVRHLAAVVEGKYASLRWLYAGLMVLVFLTAGLTIVLVFDRLRH